MNEMMSTTEQKLWYDGPNYTADSIVIHPESRQVLLVKRKTGEWALPGGFIDPGEEPLTAAHREVMEETGAAISGDLTLVFCGLVNDPRNTQTAWIETSAYLFTVPDLTAITGRDDAVDAGWHSLDHLPELYASHDEIVTRALDYLACRPLAESVQNPECLYRVDGGHMQYEKAIATKDHHVAFIKQLSTQYDSVQKRQRLQQYLDKEAFTMAHLRQSGYDGIPAQSVLCGDAIIMEALRPDDGWRWRAEAETLDNYVWAAAEKFARLETIPLPADSFAIEPSYVSFIKEGWQTIDERVVSQLCQILPDFLNQMTPHSQAIAQDLLTDLSSLRRAGTQPNRFHLQAFCHHDIRQSNIAWHPEHGSRLVDWSWSGPGEPGSDITSLLIDLHKSGHDISPYRDTINVNHCLKLIGFWLNHATWPYRGENTVRFQQFLSALSAYEVLRG